jgi:cell division protein FtsW (lipid II flippase)
MNSIQQQIFRLLTGASIVILIVKDSPYWWFAAIPWVILCIFGILATLPLFVFVGINAGGAQADWMSGGFIIGLVFVTPTILAISIAEWRRARKRRMNVVSSIDHGTSNGDPSGIVP